MGVYSGAGWGGGYRFCVHLSPPLMLSQCFFSLSLELVLQHLTLRAGPSHAGGPAERRQAVQPAPACSGAPASHTHCLVCLVIDSCCPAIGGLSAWGEGSHLKTVPHLQPLTPETPASITDTTRPAPHRTEDSKAFAGPCRPGCLVLLKLY